MLKKIRLRYAPSPTGYLHIGNARTALMNFLFAKHHNGDFILRIEDTDIERNVEDAIDSQIDNMNWLQINPDESFKKPIKKYGKYVQSEKFEVYKKHANDLLDQKKAYRCFCTSEELEIEKNRQIESGNMAPKYNKHCLNYNDKDIKKFLDEKKPFTIRFKVLENKVYKINDIVRGEMEFHSKEIGDFVILKSNAIPTYNFAVIIDDFDMQITHVVRGEEHISNTPRQCMLFEAFGWKEPTFCHLTLIVDENRKKLSKRSNNGLFFISQYKNEGYLPEAVTNYIALLGWSPKNEEEIFSVSELIDIFNENQFSKSPSTFDVKKLKWINNRWMKKIDNKYYLKFVKNFIDTTKFDINSKKTEWLNEVLLLFKNEIDYATQINEHLEIFFDLKKIDSDLIKTLNSMDDWKEMIKSLATRLESLKNFSEENIKILIKEIGVEHNKKGKDLFMPTRIATTHREHGPELAKVIYLLGRENVLNNIKKIK